MLDNSRDEGGARSDDNDYDTGGARSDDSDNNDEDDDEQHEVLSTTTTTKMMNEMKWELRGYSLHSEKARTARSDERKVQAQTKQDAQHACVLRLVNVASSRRRVTSTCRSTSYISTRPLGQDTGNVDE